MDSTELGHFSLLEKIGEGGMGQVYKARDTRLDRLVAVKLLPEARRADEEAVARFVQEAKAASALNHPNIITIHEIGEQEGRTYIIMELVDGKPLNQLIPRKGMRLGDALPIAAQVAAALTAAHAAGIVHRDLKPANIMVDAHGRVKLLDFGLAKLSARAAPAAVAGGDSTRTLAVDPPISEPGVIMGSIPYMSPEQAEGKPVDARSDIFSFGAVLYEMITGQRAFQRGSRISTLAAVVEEDPPPLSTICPGAPSELERLIARCLRKDVRRRSQTIADVRLVLEELREESDSGRAFRAATFPAGARRWLWPSAGILFVLLAAAACAWIYLNFRGTPPRDSDLARVSPNDGNSYFQPAISPDGGFVAYISDRSGKNQVWLQQVGGGDPIQLTHSNDAVSSPSFFPDGKRILYVTTAVGGQTSAIEAISALGGEPRVLTRVGRIINWDSMLSPDGSKIAFFEYNQGVVHLMTISSSGGQARELPDWAAVQSSQFGIAAWTSDSRNLLCPIVKRSEATKSDETDWFEFPVDGGKPAPTGAAAAFREAGLANAIPILMAGDRVLFAVETSGRYNAWEIRLSPGTWQVRSRPRQLTFGTLSEIPFSISAKGTVALSAANAFIDLYLVPLSPATGQPTGVTRRLTRDGRNKSVLWYLSGNPGSVYFAVAEEGSLTSQRNYHGLDLDSGKETMVSAGVDSSNRPVVSPDGRQVAYTVPEGDSYSIRVGEAGGSAAEARLLCKACGEVYEFSPDGRFLLYSPEAKLKESPTRKRTVRLLELASGKDQPWLEHPTDSVYAGGLLGRNSRWLWLWVRPPGSETSGARYLVPWSERQVPPSEWVKIPLPGAAVLAPPWRVSPTENFFYFFEGSKFMEVRFDARRASFSEPSEVQFVTGSAVTPKPDDLWAIRGRGLVFSHAAAANSSVWLMKLPR